MPESGRIVAVFHHELDVPQADLAGLGNDRSGLGDARAFRGRGSDLRQQDGGG
jgi:hypothetical protein